MDTPICDFVKHYNEKSQSRFHMPGHKGVGSVGAEFLDITEINGADILYSADGIIAESEKNAGALFGCTTFYSAEGSSLCVRAMLKLISLYAKFNNKKPHIAAYRNTHKSFISGISLLDINVTWIYPEKENSYVSYEISPSQLDIFLSSLDEAPVAVYITSPDYLGYTADIEKISKVCHRHGCLLAVDNAHGAYLKFLSPSEHPIDLGADICCDSAHKTLPVITGGAYLHISNQAPDILKEHAEKALSLFASTSPSYLILQSLDRANRFLENFNGILDVFIKKLQIMKKSLSDNGYEFYGNEPMKLTIEAKKYGYFGSELADILRLKGIECEFYDPDYLVLMPTPLNDDNDIQKLHSALLSIPKQKTVKSKAPHIPRATQILSVREAMLSASENICTNDAEGRILAEISVSCPPAVPILVSGELINASAVKCFKYYGIDTLSVIKK